MCRNGRYTERGIKELHGYGVGALARRAGVRGQARPATSSDVGVLLEPTSVVAKAWEQIERIGGRAVLRAAPRARHRRGADRPARGAARRRSAGCEVHVLDRVTDGPEAGAGRGARRDLPHRHGRGRRRPADIVIECTGVGRLVVDASAHRAPDGIVCLTGVSSGGRAIDRRHGALQPHDGARERRRLRLRQRQPPPLRGGGRGAGARPTAMAGALITRRVPLERWQDALERRPDDVKVVVGARFGTLAGHERRPARRRAARTPPT